MYFHRVLTELYLLLSIGSPWHIHHTQCLHAGIADILASLRLWMVIQVGFRRGSRSVHTALELPPPASATLVRVMPRTDHGTGE